MTQSEPTADYGATRGMYVEWTEADLAASRAQRASMMAQRVVAQISGESWAELSSEARQARTNLSDETSSPLAQESALRTLEQNGYTIV